MQILSDYLTIPFLERDRVIDKAVTTLRRLDFDTVVFSRYSGALIAPIVAYKLRKNLIFVRNSKDSTHSTLRVEGVIGGKKYMIIDDCIEKGRTLRNIIRLLWQNKNTRTMDLAGIYLYDHPMLKHVEGFVHPITREPVYFVGGRNHLRIPRVCQK